MLTFLEIRVELKKYSLLVPLKRLNTCGSCNVLQVSSILESMLSLLFETTQTQLPAATSITSLGQTQFFLP